MTRKQYGFTQTAAGAALAILFAILAASTGNGVYWGAMGVCIAAGVAGLIIALTAK